MESELRKKSVLCVQGMEGAATPERPMSGQSPASPAGKGEETGVGVSGREKEAQARAVTPPQPCQ